MVDRTNEDATNGRTWLWLALSGLSMVAAVAFVAGIIDGHQENGGGTFCSSVMGKLIIAGVFICGLIYAIWRNAKKIQTSGEPLTKREKLNRNIILACGLLGGGTGFLLAANGIANTPDEAADPLSMFFAGPLPVTVVGPLVFVWGVVMPVIAWFWHTRVIDEQEANANRDGGYYAAYAFLILAPLWWLLWRGGLLPRPDGVAIYITFSVIWTLVWFWRKYR